MNLSDQLTVFLISSGEPDYETAKRALLGQDCQFILKEVKNVAPMNAAFQTMLDTCTTPYFIQVDADMVLEPWAIRRMYEETQRESIQHGVSLRPMNRVAMLTFLLYDVHLCMNIYGVKIYRHEIMRRFPYQSSYSCEVDQVKRILAGGFFAIDLHEADALKPQTENTFGLHSPTWTPESIYRRYKRLAQKWRRFGYFWMKSIPNKLRLDLIEKGNPLDFWALAGFIAGACSNLEEEAEQNFHDRDEGWTRLSTLFPH